MPKKIIHRTVAITVLSLLTITGCGGPSTEDLMMRAAKRSRGGDNETTPPAKPETTQPADSQLAAADTTTKKPTVETTQESPDEETTGEMTPTEVLQTLNELTIKPIDQRQPSDAMDDDAKRTKAVKSLTKIAEALEKYHADKGHYPAPTLKTETGIPTLSWRVELLPYLGHDELYKKFDPTRPWNFEPNKTLLQYIPDEFVSPDRFDTKTNFQLPVFRTFMFGDGRPRKKSDVDKEDGAANTIMLVEVNDELAVEWTKPADFDPKDPTDIKADLGKVRGDGTFAVWGNGWTVLLANSLSNQQIFNAMTFDAGDGQMAGTVHRDIPLTGATDAAAAVATTPAGDSMLASVEATYRSPVPMVEMMTREPLPIAGDLAKAQSRLREIYLSKIVEAKKDEEKTALAEEMIDGSANMPADAAGAYALQMAAIRLCSEAGELNPILQAVDQRVGRFEVDAYEENITALLGFAESITRRDPDEVDGDAFVERAVPVIFAAINDDDYIRASALARHSYRLIDLEPGDEIMKSLNRLRILLGSAQREYDKAAISLANYRDDPNLVDDAATFGRFLCFIKGDWETGLPLVAMGGPKPLRELAQRDLAGADSFQNEVAIADEWWRMSEGIRNGVYRQALQNRAAYWYQRAWPIMPESLDRIHVKNRLDELKDLSPTSPLALIKRLADDLGVNLTNSLASVANVGQARVSNRDDD